MGDLNVQQRKFVVKAGMTADDVKNSKEATAMQKKYASAFDTDGQKGFSQKEADLFNATTFAEKADGSVMFWTRQKDGTKKGTKFDSKDNNIQYKTEDEVKPYIKQVKVKKATQKKEESVSFFDEKWSGHQIAKLTGDNVVTDWLQDKDKVCTDGKDDGKLSAGQYALSFAKGLIGGIPKAIVNHPVATIVTVGLGAAATIATGGAILPVLGAVGVATGVGMAGYGGYKAATAKTDGEAKQALETLGMGVTTTALSVAAADKALEKAAEAGVKSAQVSEDAGIIEKTVQMFKAIPESLTKSKEWARFNLHLPISKEIDSFGRIKKSYGNNTYRQYGNKKIVSEKMPNGIRKEFNYKGQLSEIETANGTITRFSNGGNRYEDYSWDYSITEPDGSSKTYCNGKVIIERKNDIVKEYYNYDKGEYDYYVVNNSEKLYVGTFDVHGKVIKTPSEEPDIIEVFQQLAKKDFGNGNHYKVSMLNEPFEVVKSSQQNSLQTGTTTLAKKADILDNICAKLKLGKQNLTQSDIDYLAKMLNINSKELLNLNRERYINLCKKYHPANNPNNNYTDKIFEIIQNL